ncbi:MAG: hypothetical protein ACR65R_03345 [Methylomicrobium sp.]
MTDQKKRLAQSIMNSAFGVVLGGSLLVATEVANAFECGAILDAFQPACSINNDLALGSEEGNYIGSCNGGGKCDDSVNNKLTSASNKVSAGKLRDACSNLQSIQTSLDQWLTNKPKIDSSGYLSLKTAIATLKESYECP